MFVCVWRLCCLFVRSRLLLLCLAISLFPSHSLSRPTSLTNLLPQAGLILASFKLCSLSLFLSFSLSISLYVCVFVPLYYWLISFYCKYAALQLFANLTINNICNFSIVWLLLYDLLFIASSSLLPPSTPLQTFLISKLKQQTTLSPFVTTLYPKKINETCAKSQSVQGKQMIPKKNTHTWRTKGNTTKS